jgi:hypothetical protein
MAYKGDYVWQYSDHERVMSLLPRKCCMSGESLWFKKAYRLRSYDRSGLYEDEWYSEQIYVWKTLKDG